MSDYTLRYPVDIKDEIGLNEKEINSFKGRGCRFYGRKTCVAWVREYLEQVTDPGTVDEITSPTQGC